MIVFSDFDKTLYPHYDDEIFQQNLRAIKKFRQEGNLFCLVSGRNLSSLKRVWPEYQQYLDYIILDDGAVGFDASGKILFQNLLAKNLAGQICQEITGRRSLDGMQFVYYDSLDGRPELSCNLAKLRCWVANTATTDVISRLVKQKYGRFVQAFVDKAAQPSNISWLSEPEKYHGFVDIISTQAGKENAIAQLCAKLELNDEQVITVGDDTNDVGMLKWYDGYAMQDANPEVTNLMSPNHIVVSVAELLEKITNGE